MSEWVHTDDVDLADDWDYEESASDGNITTSALATVPASDWCEYLYINYKDGHLINKVRVYISGYIGANIDRFNLGIYYDGGWECHLETSIVTNSWMEYDLDKAALVTQIKFTFHNTGGSPEQARLKEVQLYELSETPVSFEDCIFFLNCEETTGIIAYDSSGKKNHFDIRANLSSRDASYLTYAGKINNSFLFNDTDKEWLRNNNIPDYDFNNNDFTFLVWFIESNPPANVANILAINTSTYGNAILFTMQSNGKLRLNDISAHESLQAYDDGYWHLGGYTYDSGTKTVQMIVDGINARASFVMATTFAINDLFSIGQQYGAGGGINYCWDGRLDIAMLFLRKLTTEEIAWLINKYNARDELITARPRINGSLAGGIRGRIS